MKSSTILSVIGLLAAGTAVLATEDGAAKYSEADLFQWNNFLTRYQKSYKSQEEFEQRRAVFMSNLRLLELANDMGNRNLGITKFFDLTREEFQQTRLMKKGSAPKFPAARYEPPSAIGPIPPSWDWRNKNAVSPVKDQGSVGSCWAFSTCENIEGQWALQHGQLYSLSAEFLVDCDNKVRLRSCCSSPLQPRSPITTCSFRIVVYSEAGLTLRTNTSLSVAGCLLTKHTLTALASANAIPVRSVA